MMQEQIKNDMVTAMKSREVEKTILLKVLMGEFSRIGKEVSDVDVLKIIRKMYENAKELKNEFEMRILGDYLPKMLDSNQIKTIVSEIIESGGFSTMKDMGKVMAELKNHKYSTQIDGKIASGFVRELLNK